MLNIQPDISKSSASFGNIRPRVIFLGQDNRDDKKTFAADSYGNTATDAYTQEDYDSDKSFLEKQKENVENLVNNVDTPKPVKTFGKIILGAIAVAMGFVSMKWATLGSWKVAEDIIKNPKTQKIAKSMAKPFKDGIIGAKDIIKKAGLDKNVSKVVSEGITSVKGKFNDSKAGKVVNGFGKKIKDFTLYKQGAELLNKQFAKVRKFAGEKFEKITGISKEKVKSYVSNFFGVSGAVTAGVDVIQSDGRQTENI